RSASQIYAAPIVQDRAQNIQNCLPVSPVNIRWYISLILTDKHDLLLQVLTVVQNSISFTHCPATINSRPFSVIADRLFAYNAGGYAPAQPIRGEQCIQYLNSVKACARPVL
ncbi:hypothetical protein, partial [Pseudomonas syringae]|uniref:hypothetical protein n=1 Tax=Pseudomonas syringae TaxID=317 RepID=UPI001D0C613B